MKKYLRIVKTIICLFLFFLLPQLALAEDIKVSDVIGTTGTTQAETLKQKEEETENSFLDQLLLKLPDITDNPSHIITFTDPSEKKEGVQLEVDSKGFQSIKSPYSFQALAIGSHLIRFKFVDKYGATQIIERDLIVIPRPPILNTPVNEANTLKISGTALAGSEVTLILNSDQKMSVSIVEVDKDGMWQATIEDNIPKGIYTFSAFTKKYGYASNLSEPLTLDYSGKTTQIVNDDRQNIHFAFRDITMDNIPSVLRNNTDLVITLFAVFFIGFLIALLISSFLKNRKEGREIKKVANTLDKPLNKDEKPMTLMEKLGMRLDGDEDQNLHIDQDIKEERKKEKPEKQEEKTGEPEEKIVTKIDFLKNFKHLDPDDEQGVEKKKEEKKEKIKVTLTSKDTPK